MTDKNTLVEKETYRDNTAFAGTISGKAERISLIVSHCASNQAISWVKRDGHEFSVDIRNDVEYAVPAHRFLEILPLAFESKVRLCSFQSQLGCLLNKDRPFNCFF